MHCHWRIAAASHLVTNRISVLACPLYSISNYLLSWLHSPVYWCIASYNAEFCCWCDWYVWRSTSTGNGVKRGPDLWNSACGWLCASQESLERCAVDDWSCREEGRVGGHQNIESRLHWKTKAGLPVWSQHNGPVWSPQCGPSGGCSHQRWAALNARTSLTNNTFFSWKNLLIVLNVHF